MRPLYCLIVIGFKGLIDPDSVKLAGVGAWVKNGVAKQVYDEKAKYENLEKAAFALRGRYDIPEIAPIDSMAELPDFIGFNYAKTASQKQDKGCHFFLDDYQFERLWRRPQDYLALLSQFGCVMTPDFSLYADFPAAMQIYNHYRKHWLGAYWQQHGITVISTIGWSDEKSFEWCFDGEPIGGAVAVSSVGTQRNAAAKELFVRGYCEMVRRIEPSQIIFYGNVPDECKGNIVKIQTFQSKWM